MQDLKITETDFVGNDITSLDENYYEGEADFLKQRFDASTKNVIAPKFNQLIDALAEEGAAQYIGAKALNSNSGETIQSIVEYLWDQLQNITLGTLPDGSVTTAKMAENAVTAEKISDGAVTSAKLALAAVLTESIADGSVTEEKLADAFKEKLADFITSGAFEEALAMKAPKVHEHNYSDVKNAQIGENLLINWDFRDPVNQRGISGAWGVGYGLDMWTCEYNGGHSVNNGYLTLGNTWLIQCFEYTLAEYPLNGKKLTVSIMLQDGSIVSRQITPSATQNVELNVPGTDIWVQMRNGVVWKEFRMHSDSSVNILAVKLEVGSVSTLANSAPMDYGEELQKCRRYFFALPAGNWQHYGLALAMSSEKASIYFSSGVPMRIYNPSIVVAENLAFHTGVLTGTFTDCRSSGGNLFMILNQSGLTADKVYEFQSRDKTPKLWISAEL